MRIDGGAVAFIIATSAGAVAWWHAGGWLAAIAFTTLAVIFSSLFLPGFTVSFSVSHRSGSERERVVHGSSRNSIASNAVRHVDPVVPRPVRAVVGILRASIVTWPLVLPIHLFWRVLLFFVALLLTRAAVWLAFDLWFRRQQSQRDRLAREILATVRRGGSLRRPFFLYLRPFRVTGALRAVEPMEFELAQERRYPTTLTSPSGEQIGLEIPIVSVQALDVISQAADELNREWESLFERGLHDFGDLIALGRPGEAIGSGRLATTDGEWRDVVRDLVPAARGCFVIPTASGSTRWEIELLRDRDGFRDCLFLMPPLDPTRNTPEQWQATRRALAGTLPLPEHPGPAALLAFDAALRPHLTLLTQHRWFADGNVRMFVNPQELAGAVARLLPVASRDPRTDWDRALESTLSMVENLGDEKALARLGFHSAPGSRIANGPVTEIVRTEEIWHAAQNGMLQLCYRATCCDTRIVAVLEVLQHAGKCHVENVSVLAENDYDRVVSEARHQLWRAMGIA
jgi:hypothetical protein